MYGYQGYYDPAAYAQYVGASGAEAASAAAGTDAAAPAESQAGVEADQEETKSHPQAAQGLAEGGPAAQVGDGSGNLAAEAAAE